ncbi:hypothetical protein BN126_2289 [Cronobacter sakazakii 680]|nr:hypothetical protein BN126_2289 [Cronobacter sakazakii 680]
MRDIRQPHREKRKVGRHNEVVEKEEQQKEYEVLFFNRGQGRLIHLSPSVWRLFLLLTPGRAPAVAPCQPCRLRRVKR